MAKAKTKATPKKEEPVEDDGTITREKAQKPAAPKTPPTPKASDVEKTESFTAAFRNDAHSAADHFLKHNTDNPEEISREESDAGDDGVRLTLTYK